jgi:hypothetical protein
VSVSGVSPSAVNSFQPSVQQNSFLQAFQKLANQLGAGNLAGAQQAYAELKQVQGPSQSDPNNPLSQALNQIGQSLQYGNLGDALKALISLLQQLGGDHGSRLHASSDGQGSSASKNNTSSGVPTNNNAGQFPDSASLTITDSIDIAINSGNNSSPTLKGTGASQSANSASLTLSETIGLTVNFSA